MKKYLSVRFVMNNRWINNPLRLTEVHLINKILKDGAKDMRVDLIECTTKEYSVIFG